MQEYTTSLDEGNHALSYDSPRSNLKLLICVASFQGTQSSHKPGQPFFVGSPTYLTTYSFLGKRLTRSVSDSVVFYTSRISTAEDSYRKVFYGTQEYLPTVAHFNAHDCLCCFFPGSKAPIVFVGRSLIGTFDQNKTVSL